MEEKREAALKAEEIEKIKKADANVKTMEDFTSPEDVYKRQSLSFTKEGTDKFAAATKEAVEAGNDTIGIYYDGTFVSVPSVRQEIKDGQAQIDGMKAVSYTHLI